MPIVDAIADGTSPGSESAASGTNHVPSGNASEAAGRDLEREPRLAGAAGAGEGHEPRLVDQPPDLLQLALAADERA